MWMCSQQYTPDLQVLDLVDLLASLPCAPPSHARKFRDAAVEDAAADAAWHEEDGEELSEAETEEGSRSVVSSS